MRFTRLKRFAARSILIASIAGAALVGLAWVASYRTRPVPANYYGHDFAYFVWIIEESNTALSVLGANGRMALSDDRRLFVRAVHGNFDIGYVVPAAHPELVDEREIGACGFAVSRYGSMTPTMMCREVTADLSDAERRTLMLGFASIFKVSIPMWFPLACSLAAPAMWGRVYLARRKRRQRGLCRSCGYNLKLNTSGRCPECGTPVAIASPSGPGEAAARTQDLAEFR